MNKLGLILRKHSLVEAATDKELVLEILGIGPDMIFLDYKTDGGYPARNLEKTYFSTVEGLETFPVIEPGFVDTITDIVNFSVEEFKTKFMMIIAAEYQKEYVTSWIKDFVKYYKPKENKVDVVLCTNTTHLAIDHTADLVSRELIKAGVNMTFCLLINDKTLYPSIEPIPHAFSPVMIAGNYKSILNLKADIIFWNLSDFLGIPREYRKEEIVFHNFTATNNTDTNLSIYESTDILSDIIGKIKPSTEVSVSEITQFNRISWGALTAGGYIILKKNGVEFYDVRGE